MRALAALLCTPYLQLGLLLPCLAQNVEAPINCRTSKALGPVVPVLAWFRCLPIEPPMQSSERAPENQLPLCVFMVCHAARRTAVVRAAPHARKKRRKETRVGVVPSFCHGRLAPKRCYRRTQQQFCIFLLTYVLCVVIFLERYLSFLERSRTHSNVFFFTVSVRSTPAVSRTVFEAVQQQCLSTVRAY